MLRKTITAAVLMAAIGTATPALAAIVTNPDGSATISSDTTIGDNFILSFDGSETGSVIPGLTSTLTLTFAGISGNSYLFNYLLNNTSSAPTTSSSVTAFGFNIDPNALLASSSVTGAFDVVSSGQVSQGYNLEMCFKNGQNNNCAGGTNGITMGNSGSGQISLGFSSLPDQITLSDYLVRYQQVNGSGSAVGTPVGAVPEPATWAMMLLGFAGIGAAMRRGRKTVALAQIA
jgi:PEP-CTERM motif